MNHGVPPQDWDHALQRRGGSILQSRVWAQFQLELGREPLWQQGEGYQWLGFVRASRGIKYLLSAYGPVVDSQKAMAEAVKSLRSAGAQLGVDFVRLEPQAESAVAELRQAGARPIGEFSPQYSQVVDLTADLDALRSDLASGHRNLINGTERRGIKIRQSQDAADYESFLAMLKETAKHSKVRFWPDEYYRQLWQALQPAGVARLYLAEVGGSPVAAALFYDWGGTRYYAHAGAFQEQNRKIKASVSLVWQALVDAKEAGLKNFDLWGVAPEGDEHHHLAALSRFKRAFGGKQLNYAGSWDLPLKPAKYRLYAAYRKLRGMD